MRCKKVKPWESELNKMNQKKWNAKTSADRLIFFLVKYFVLSTLWFCSFYLHSATFESTWSADKNLSFLCALALYFFVIIFDCFFKFPFKYLFWKNAWLRNFFFRENLTYIQYLHSKIDKAISPNFPDEGNS